MKFFNPTGEYKEIQLLQYIEDKPDCTQKELADVIEGATSMVNVYIKELEAKSFLIREYVSPKTVFYKITPEGVKRKNYLIISYTRELLDLYRLAKKNIESFLIGLENKGYKDILLYGAGEVAETIIGVLRDKEVSSLNIVVLVDDDEEKIGSEMMGYRVIAREEINEYKHDAVVITSYTFEDDISERLKELGYPKGKVEIERFFGV